MRLLTTCLFSCALLWQPLSQAQVPRYPNKPITVILPVASGSSGDVAFRTLGAKMEARLGQPLVFENVAGAAGLLGAERARKATPDGYTLVGGNDSMLLNLPLLNRNAQFDPIKDFEPITQVATIDIALVVHGQNPARSVADLVRIAKEKPGRMDYASGGVASPQNVMMELLKNRAGISVTHIPFRGATQAITAVAAGEVPVMFQGIASVKPYLQSGHLRAVATTGQQRSPLLPEVPTLSESGYPGFFFGAWVGFLAPTGTPREVVQAIQQAAAGALADPALRNSFLSLGLTPIANTPDQFRRVLADDYKRIAELVKTGALKPE